MSQRKQNLQTGPQFHHLQCILTRTFESHPLFNQQTELYTMLIFCYYTSIRQTLNEELEAQQLPTLDGTVWVPNHKIDPSSEAVFNIIAREALDKMIKAEKLFVEQLVSLIDASGLAEDPKWNHFGSPRKKTITEIFTWLGKRLADMVRQCMKFASKRIVVFSPIANPASTKETTSVSPQIATLVYAMAHIGRELVNLVMPNVHLACVVLNGIKVCQYWQTMLDDNVGCQCDESLVRSLVFTKLGDVFSSVRSGVEIEFFEQSHAASYLNVESFNEFTSDHESDLRLFVNNGISTPDVLAKNDTPPLPATQNDAWALKMSGQGLPEHSTPPTTFGNIPLFVLWPLLSHAIGDFSNAQYHKDLINEDPSLANPERSTQLFSSICSMSTRRISERLANMIETQTYYGVVEATMWPPDEIVVGTDASAPYNSASASRISELGRLLGPKLTNAYVDQFLHRTRGYAAFMYDLTSALDLVKNPGNNAVISSVLRESFRTLHRITSALSSDITKFTGIITLEEESGDEHTLAEGATGPRFGCTLEYLNHFSNMDFTIDMNNHNGTAATATTTTTTTPTTEFANPPKRTCSPTQVALAPSLVDIPKLELKTLDGGEQFYNPYTQLLETQPSVPGKKLKNDVTSLMNQLNSIRKSAGLPLLWIVDEGIIGDSAAQYYGDVVKKAVESELRTQQEKKEKNLLAATLALAPGELVKSFDVRVNRDKALAKLHYSTTSSIPAETFMKNHAELKESEEPLEFEEVDTDAAEDAGKPPKKRARATQNKRKRAKQTSSKIPEEATSTTTPAITTTAGKTRKTSKQQNGTPAQNNNSENGRPKRKRTKLAETSQ